MRVVETEEKGSAVNIASHMLLDGFRGAYDAAVLVTNDSDLIEPILDVVYCGTAASSKSAAVGAYCAGPGNRFWRTLFDIALTPTVLHPHELATGMAESISQTAILVLPSTSAAAKRYWHSRYRHELAEFLGRSP